MLNVWTRNRDVLVLSDWQSVSGSSGSLKQDKPRDIIDRVFATSHIDRYRSSISLQHNVQQTFISHHTPLYYIVKICVRFAFADLFFQKY